MRVLASFFIFELELKKDRFEKNKHQQAATDLGLLIDGLKQSFAAYQSNTQRQPDDKKIYWEQMAQSWQESLLEAACESPAME